jgi:hypothetical protein
MSAALIERAIRNGAVVVLALGLSLAGCASTGGGTAPPTVSPSSPASTQTVTVTASLRPR